MSIASVVICPISDKRLFTLVPAGLRATPAQQRKAGRQGVDGGGVEREGALARPAMVAIGHVGVHQIGQLAGIELVRRRRGALRDGRFRARSTSRSRRSGASVLTRRSRIVFAVLRSGLPTSSAASIDAATRWARGWSLLKTCHGTLDMGSHVKRPAGGGAGGPRRVQGSAGQEDCPALTDENDARSRRLLSPAPCAVLGRLGALSASGRVVGMRAAR